MWNLISSKRSVVKLLIAITININDGMISQWLIPLTLAFGTENPVLFFIVYIAILHQFTKQKRKLGKAETLFTGNNVQVFVFFCSYFKDFQNK